jgi:hypothetical protein
MISILGIDTKLVWHLVKPGQLPEGKVWMANKEHGDPI